MSYESVENIVNIFLHVFIFSRPIDPLESFSFDPQ